MEFYHAFYRFDIVIKKMLGFPVGLCVYLYIDVYIYSALGVLFALCTSQTVFTVYFNLFLSLKQYYIYYTKCTV